MSVRQPGVGTAPSIGGTLSGGTAGSVLFINPANKIAQDNANFSYDVSNVRLTLGDTVANSFAQLGIKPLTAGRVAFAIKSVAGQSVDLTQWQNSSGVPVSVMDKSGAIFGIGTATPGTGLLYGALNTPLHVYSSGVAISAVQAVGSALLYAESGSGNAILGLSDITATTNYRILDILSSGGKMIMRRLTDAYSSALANALTIDYTTGDNLGRVGINTTTPGTRFNMIDTEDFRIGHTGATGDLLAGMAMYTATGSTNFSIFGNAAAGGNTGTLQLMYTGGVGGNSFYSAAEITNTGSGFGNLLLMKSGGNVGIGLTAPTLGKLHVTATGLDLPGIYSFGGGSAGSQNGPSIHGHNGTGNANTLLCQISNSNGDAFSVTESITMIKGAIVQGGSTDAGLIVGTGSVGGSSGTKYGFSTAPTITNSGTSGYTALGISVTESSLGSGSNQLVDLKVGGSSKFALNNSGKNTTYAGATTTGYGVPAIYGSDRKTGLTAAQALATYTVGAADGSYKISANVNVTTATAHNFTVTCTYTDEGNTSRTLTLGFTQLAGATLLSNITNITGAGPYESPVYHIRCKASTTIIIATTGTFTTVTYNFEENISQVA